MRQGPLTAIRVVEFTGIGPGPFCGMLLSDMGAEVVRIDRPGATKLYANDILTRGRRSVSLDLKSPAGLDRALALLATADVLVEGYRPGVMERLGLGPDIVLARNPRLVYARMTGWGQTGPLVYAAGHDINYIALTGALAAIGPPGGAPTPPLNLVGDFGGGALYLAMGVCAALVERQTSGKGQVVDAAMVDGAASLMSMPFGLLASGRWVEARGANSLDGGAAHYGCYACKDGRYVAVGAVEPEFYAILLEKLGLSDHPELADLERAPENWPRHREILAARFAQRTRDEWEALLSGADACFAPVLSMSEAADHPHMKARGTLDRSAGYVQPAPAPRFSRTPGAIQGPPCEPGADSEAIWAELAGASRPNLELKTS